MRRLSSVFAGHRPTDTARLALRTRSLLAREAMARAATDGEHGDADLLRLAASDDLPARLLAHREGARRLAALALTWAGQGRDAGELAAAAMAYLAMWAAGAGPALPSSHHLVAAQSLLLTGRAEDVRRLLPALTRLPAGARPSVDADLAHPWADPPGPGRGSAVSPASLRSWEELLSAPFTAHGHAPLRVAGALDRPAAGAAPGTALFDRLTVPGVAAATVDGPLVSVVVPCFRPDAGLLTAVSSLAAQTHGPLEILVVDDASGRDYESWFERALALDDRVRLIRRDTNGGSYLARGDALREAAGELVTFQDADDWSHPERIAAQVALLAADPAAPACHALAVRVHDDLTHQWLGYRPVRTNASSLMVRTEVARRLGGFLPVRKGADSEYAERIAAEAGPVVSTGTPLGLSRLRQGSLSRSDFSYQWSAPERLAFKGTYRAWQRGGRTQPFPAPSSFVRGLEQDRTCDRVDTAYLADLSGDPTTDPGPAARVWHLSRGCSTVRTAVWHLERPWDPGPSRREMHDRWFDRVVAEPAWQALSRTEPVHLDRLVVLEPSVLLLQGEQECAVTTDRVQVHLLPEDEALTGAVTSVVRRWFGVEPEWVRA